MNQIALLSLAKQCGPTQAEARQWFAGAQKTLGAFGLATLGVSPSCLADWRSGSPMRGTSLRLIWLAWSITHCPSNLSNVFTFATWGRFNPAMPQDFRGQALRLLHRKNGPARAAETGKPKPARWGRPWNRATALRGVYLVPGSGLPPLLG